jgi:hypothetical protein
MENTENNSLYELMKVYNLLLNKICYINYINFLIGSSNQFISIGLE